MSTLQKAEVRFLSKVADEGGLTIYQALSIQLNDPAINFGTGIDAIDVINKFLSLGFIEYQSETGKFVPAKD